MSLSCKHEIMARFEYQEKEAEQNQRILVPSTAGKHVSVSQSSGAANGHIQFQPVTMASRPPGP